MSRLHTRGSILCYDIVQFRTLDQKNFDVRSSLVCNLQALKIIVKSCAFFENYRRFPKDNLPLGSYMQLYYIVLYLRRHQFSELPAISMSAVNSTSQQDQVDFISNTTSSSSSSEHLEPPQLITYYEDVTDEVSSHFNRALSSRSKSSSRTSSCSTSCNGSTHDILPAQHQRLSLEGKMLEVRHIC